MSYGRRNMKEDDDLYRAVITTELGRNHVRAGESQTTVFGPYSTVGPAKARVTEARNRERDYGYLKVVDARVERAVVTWETVD